MARYVDGYVIPIKKKNVKKYKKMATMGMKTWMKYGALDYYECIGDKLDVPYGTSFPKLCKLKKDETVVFAFIVYKSKAHCVQVNKKVHAEFAKMDPKEMEELFSMKRFSTGGFKVLVSNKK
ncbi:DUF1428 domain-containing protein [Bdellovibrio sp. HCB288]|uniref:DUF1428 domain-containing protein n=1 Tax=Bdellovibrio sp. HCB288 TaxID=3394355 RepID=UPI0039B69770